MSDPLLHRPPVLIIQMQNTVYTFVLTLPVRHTTIPEKFSVQVLGKRQKREPCESQGRARRCNPSLYKGTLSATCATDSGKGSGRPPEEGGSQKTCLNDRLYPRGKGMALSHSHGLKTEIPHTARGLCGFFLFFARDGLFSWQQTNHGRARERDLDSGGCCPGLALFLFVS